MTFRTGSINDVVSRDLCEINLQQYNWYKTRPTLSFACYWQAQYKECCLFLLAGRKLASTIMEVESRWAWTLASQTLDTGAFFVTGTRARPGVACTVTWYDSWGRKNIPTMWIRSKSKPPMKRTDKSFFASRGNIGIWLVWLARK